jgi:hypothetical protein
MTQLPPGDELSNLYGLGRSIGAERSFTESIPYVDPDLVQAAASQLINTEIARITLARVDQILKPRYPKRTA